MIAASVAVRVLAGPETLLHYRVPDHLAPALAAGSLVRVPLGKRFSLGVVWNFSPPPASVAGHRLRLIQQLACPHPVLTPALLHLAEWIVLYYSATWQSVLEMMIPPAVRSGQGPRIRQHLRLSGDPGDAFWNTLAAKAPRQSALAQLLRRSPDGLEQAEALRRSKASAAVVTAMIRKGLLERSERVQVRHAYDDAMGLAEMVPAQRLLLNPGQSQVLSQIQPVLGKGGFAVFVLQGVTGSGKTEVYLSAMEQVLQEGGSALYLVPEVALTPQTVGRIRSRFSWLGNEGVVVWHSFLSGGERADAWSAVARGQARVVVGARSALFAPLSGLRLIVVDEEHEPAYKQEESPRYHARDVAVYRARLEQAVCLLGSATPSLETYANIQRGKYHHLRLDSRIDDRCLPRLHIIDLRREILRRNNTLPISGELLRLMRERLEAREQTILFINRRGYVAHLLCAECGHVVHCPHCSITLTHHKTDESARCHLCGHEEPVPQNCPSCGARGMRGRAFGTQRIEEAVRLHFPRCRIRRVDTDSVRRRHLFRETLAEFRAGKIDILVGTQMIGKGLDFPNVTLVGLVDADLSLHIPDFRAHERTFQLLVQVSGRAGRGDRPGDVVVQTFTPHAMPIQFGRRAQVDDFLEAEAQTRRQLGYPPYRHLVRQIVRGRNADKVCFFAEQFAKQVEGCISAEVEIRGPAPCPVEKAKDHYRYHTWFFASRILPLLKILNDINAGFPWPEDVVSVLDTDPVSVG